MKILLIHHRLPYPLLSGMDKATWNLIKILSTAHEITFIVPVDFRHSTHEEIEQVRGICRRLVVVPVINRAKFVKKWQFWYWWRFLRLFFLRPNIVTENFYPTLAREISKLCMSEKFDLVQAMSLASAEYLRFSGPIPTMILAHDVYFDLTRSQFLFTKSFIKKFVLWLSYHAYLHYEAKIYMKCHRLLALSAKDLGKIVMLTGDLRYTWILPDPVEADELPQSVIMSSIRHHDPSSLVFVGGLGPSFNQDAVLYFCQDIFPLIKKRISKAKFYIVGENPPDHIRDLEKDDGVFVTGTVPNVRPFIEHAAVYVAPIRYGGGVKSKIIEALSMGKAIVTTSIALEGLPDTGEDVFRIQNDPEGFANEVVKLLQDSKLRSFLGICARKLFERSYSLTAVAPQILRIYGEIANSLSGAHTN